jgi:hypothetical protein
MPNTANTETYDGTTWSEVNNLNTSRDKAGSAGTQAAAVIYGGFISPPAGSTDVTEEYDGTSWTTVPGVLSQDMDQMAAFGTQTAAVSAGGYNYSASPPKSRAVTEEYNGSTWTANPSPSGDLGAANYACSGVGTQTAGLSIGGNPGAKTITEEYNGTTWSAGGTLIAGKARASAAGTQTDAIISGGPTGTVVYGYDGSAWSTRPSMAVSRDETGGTTPAPASSTLVIGGSPTLSSTELFTGAVETATASIITSS